MLMLNVNVRRSRMLEDSVKEVQYSHFIFSNQSKHYFIFIVLQVSFAFAIYTLEFTSEAQISSREVETLTL